jgi:hypothetical protein
MPVASYIPAKDADFDPWFLNLDTLITADPTDYGLIAGDAVIIGAQYDSWHPAYLAATNPTTRSPTTVAAKTAARVTAESVIRPYCQAIARDASVSNELKVGLGLNLPNSTRPPIPAPLVAPTLSFRSAQPFVHVMAYADPEAPVGKAKPVGAIGVEIWRKIGTTAETDPAACSYYGTKTKAPFRSTFLAPDVGKLATYFARFVNRSGPDGEAAVGPWSAPLTMAIV